MTGETSSSSHSSFNGSNALSHAYIQYPPLRCHVPGSRSLFYDDGNKIMLSLTSNQVIIYKTGLWDEDLKFCVSTYYYAFVGVFMESCSIQPLCC